MEFSFGVIKHHDVKVKVSYSQLGKLKSFRKNTADINIRLSSDMIGTNNNNLSHNYLSINRQVAGIFNSFASNSFKDIKLWKIHLPKMIQPGELVGRSHGPLMKVSLPLMKNVLTPLAKSVLILLWSTTVAPAADGWIYKKY